MNVIGQCVLISVCRSVSFCNKIKVASCICVSAKLVRMHIIAVAAPWLQSVLESRLTYFMTVKYAACYIGCVMWNAITEWWIDPVYSLLVSLTKTGPRTGLLYVVLTVFTAVNNSSWIHLVALKCANIANIWLNFKENFLGQAPRNPHSGEGLPKPQSFDRPHSSSSLHISYPSLGSRWNTMTPTA